MFRNFIILFNKALQIDLVLDELINFFFFKIVLK